MTSKDPKKCKPARFFTPSHVFLITLNTEHPNCPYHHSFKFPTTLIPPLPLFIPPLFQISHPLVIITALIPLFIPLLDCNQATCFYQLHTMSISKPLNISSQSLNVLNPLHTSGHITSSGLPQALGPCTQQCHWLLMPTMSTTPIPHHINPNDLPGVQSSILKILFL